MPKKSKSISTVTFGPVDPVPQQMTAARSPSKDTMNIDSVTLFASDLKIQHAFYAATLGLNVVARTPDSVTFQAGRTLLTFRQHGDAGNISHLAFDVPRNQVDGAEAWLRRRVALLEDSAGTSRFPFSAGWNSESLYFEDAAGNILEFIARHDLPNDIEAPFGSASVLHVSELGVVVPDVLATVLKLQRRFGLSSFKGQSQTFSPMGSPEGLLIVVQEGRGWFSVERPAAAAPYELTFTQGKQCQSLRNRDLRELIRIPFITCRNRESTNSSTPRPEPVFLLLASLGFPGVFNTFQSESV